MNLIIFAIIWLLSFNVFAAAPTLENLTDTQVKGVLEDLATSMVPSTVTPASSYGTVFGFEVGLVGGISDSKTIDNLAQEDVGNIPGGGLMAAATGPFGLGAELIYLPLDVGDFEYSYTSIAGRWTITDVFSFIPVDMKLRVQITNGEIKWQQDISGVDTTFKYENSSIAYNLTFSKRLLIFEPYAGFGMINSENSLSATGATTVFDAAVTASQREDVEFDDFQYYVGANVHLLIFTLGAEYGKAFGNSIIRGKLSMGF